MKPSYVIFDADCGFCQQCIRLLKKLDWFRRFECLPLQEELVYLRFPGLNKSECEQELKLVINSGKIYGGADAVITLGFKIPLLFPLSCLFYLSPLRQVARWGYKKIAANRYRISAQCALKKDL